MMILTTLVALCTGWTSPEIAVTPPSNEPSYTLPLFGYAYGASNGANSLVVWEDQDRVPGGIWATRLGANGALLDPNGIYLGDGTHPAVAFDGTTFLVVIEGLASNNVGAVRVNVAGQIVGTSPLVITGPSGRASAPTVSFDGTNFVVGLGEPGGGPIEFVRVASDGTVLDAIARRIVSNASIDFSDRRPVAVASVAGTTLLAWAENRTGGCEVMGARVLTDGTVIDTTPYSLGVNTALFDECQPYAAADGAGFAVAWAGRAAGGTNSFPWLTRIGAVGAPSAPVQVAAESTFEHPAVAFVDGSWLVTWYRLQALHAARVGSSGAVLDATRVVLNLNGSRINWPTLVSSGTAALAVYGKKMQGWSDYTPGTALISSSAATPPATMSQSLVGRTSPMQACGRRASGFRGDVPGPGLQHEQRR